MNVTPNGNANQNTMRSKTSLEPLRPHSQDSVDELPLPPTPTVHQEYRYEAIPADTRRTSRTSTSSTISPKRSQSQPPKSLPPMSNGNGHAHMGNGNGHLGNGHAHMGNGHMTNGHVGNGGHAQLGITPPMIDRHSKPSRMSRGDGYHTYNAHRSIPTDGSLDRRTHMRDMKMVRKKKNFLTKIWVFCSNFFYFSDGL